MIKFVLAAIAVILVLLGIYTYSNQTTEKSGSTPTVSEKKTEVMKTEKVSPPSQKATDKKSSAKNITVKSPKVSLEEEKEEMKDEEDIGKGLTLEGIENADVSDEEKKALLDDLVYNHSLTMEDTPSLTEEEVIKMMEEDLKNSPNQ